MAAITEAEMVTEFFELWEAKVRGGLSPAAGLDEIRGERPDLMGAYCRGGKTPLAKSMAKGGSANV